MGDEDKVITKEDAIKALKGLFLNGLVRMDEIANGIDQKAVAFLRNKQDEENEALANSVREKLGEKPLDELDKLINTRAENEKFLVQNAVRAQVGSEKIKNAKGEEVSNAAYEYAMKMCNGKTGRDLSNALEGLKTDNIMQRLLGEQADHTSEFNHLENGGSDKAGILSNASTPMEV